MSTDRLRATFCIVAVSLALHLFSGPAIAQVPPPERAPAPPPIQAIDPVAAAERRAAKALAVLDRHCARCHEAEKLNRRLPAAPIANILDLDAIANRRDLVRPGYPEGSPLYVSMFTRHMPYDVFQDLAGGDEPSPSEIEDIRDWISGLPKHQFCKVKRPSDDTKSDDTKNEGAAPPPDRPASGRRLLSLVTLLTACDGPEVRRRYQQAATKLINLLSNGAKPVRLTPVSKDGLLLSFDLTDIGWTAETWDWLASRAPNAGSKLLGTNSSSQDDKFILRADWLADQAMDPGVYARLVGLPNSLPELFAAFRIDERDRDVAASYVLNDSTATGTARNLMRIEADQRQPLWVAQDLANADKENAPRLLATRAITQLPNGFPAFALYHRDGSTRANVHAAAVPSDVAQSGAVAAGLNCLACHGSGLQSFESGQANRSDTPGGWQARRDNISFLLAMREAGLEPNSKIDGLEPVRALAARYGRQLNLRQAAAELGLTSGALRQALQLFDSKQWPSARRLLQEFVTRDEFEGLRHRITWSGQEDAARSASQPSQQVEEDAGLRLSLWTDKTGYRKGDEVILHAASSEKCHLTLISVDASRDAVVIFPSEYQDDNLLVPGETQTVPSPSSGFRLRADSPDREIVIGICMAGDRRSPPGIIHDYELQPFTLLGDWADHTAKTLKADEAERRNAGKPTKRTRRRRRGRRIKRPPTRPTKLPLRQDWALVIVPAMLDENGAGTKSGGGPPRDSNEAIGPRSSSASQ